MSLVRVVQELAYTPTPADELTWAVWLGKRNNPYYEYGIEYGASLY